MNCPVETSLDYEQLMFDEFSGDYKEKIYPQPDLNLLRRCNSEILNRVGIALEDWEARKSSADYIGQMQVAMYNRLSRVEEPTDSLIEEVYSLQCLRLLDRNEVKYG